MDQLALYIEQAKRNESQSTDFDLIAVADEIQKKSAPIKETAAEVFEDIKETAETVADEVYTSVEDAAQTAVKKFDKIITVYNDGNNALICYMLFIIIVLMFLNLCLHG